MCAQATQISVRFVCVYASSTIPFIAISNHFSRCLDHCFRSFRSLLESISIDHKTLEQWKLSSRFWICNFSSAAFFGSPESPARAHWYYTYLGMTSFPPVLQSAPCAYFISYFPIALTLSISFSSEGNRISKQWPPLWYLNKIYNNVTSVFIFIDCWPWSIKGHTQMCRASNPRQQTGFSFFMPPKSFNKPFEFLLYNNIV